MQILQDMIEAMTHPQTRHAAVVHMPIALAMLGVLIAFLSAIQKKCLSLRWVAIGVFVLLAASAKFATLSGEDSEHALPQLSEAIYDIVDSHEHKADWIWKYACVAVLILLASLAPKLRSIGGWIGVAAALFIAGSTAYVGHLGGTLVYKHGLGTPDFIPQVVETTDMPPADDDAAPLTGDPRVAFFTAEIRPILEDHCMGCHNPERSGRSAELDQTTIAGMLRGGLSGPAIIPGNPAESLIVIAMRHQDDYEMPPKADPLPESLIARIERWIQDGAAWD